jgi:hypothetical protein
LSFPGLALRAPESVAVAGALTVAVVVAGIVTVTAVAGVVVVG